MNLYIKCVLLIGFVFFSVTSMAKGSIGIGEITSLSFQNRDLMIYSDDWNNANDCERINAVILKYDDQNFEKAYSLILSAYMGGKKLSAYSDGCKSFDEKTYNYIRGWKYLRIY